MRLLPVLGLCLFSILACSSGGGGDDTGRDPSDYVSTTGPDHCGTITASEEWAADLNPHTISCTVYVDGGTLTIRPGTEILVSNDAGLYVSYRETEAGLVIDGTESAPVSFAGADSSERGAWGGIFIYGAANDAKLSIQHATIDGAGGYYSYGNLHVEGAEPLVANVTLSGSEEAGFYFSDGARFGEGSENITVVDSAQAGAMAVDNADSFPEAGADLASNDDPRIWLGGGDVVASVTWGNPGVPYVIASTMYVEGTAQSPAVLTIEPGVEIQAANDVGIYLSYRGGASGLLAEGAANEPIRFTAAEMYEPGAWSGIVAHDAVSDADFRLNYVTVEYGGGYYTYSNLESYGANPSVRNTTLQDSEEGGFYFTDGARFADDSGMLTATANAWSGSIGCDAADSVPEADADLDGNDVDLVYVQGGELNESASWGDIGVPYAPDTFYLEGTAGNPAVLTLGAGATLAFTNDSGLYVGYRGGAAGLAAEGTAEEPVTFTAAELPEAGAWTGVMFYDATDDEASVLENIVIEYAGGYYSYGNLSLDDASPTVNGAVIRDSEEWGIYLDGDSDPSLSNVSYSDNAEGNINR